MLPRLRLLTWAVGQPVEVRQHSALLLLRALQALQALDSATRGIPRAHDFRGRRGPLQRPVRSLGAPSRAQALQRGARTAAPAGAPACDRPPRRPEAPPCVALATRDSFRQCRGV